MRHDAFPGGRSPPQTPSLLPYYIVRYYIRIVQKVHGRTDGRAAPPRPPPPRLAVSGCSCAQASLRTSARACYGRQRRDTRRFRRPVLVGLDARRDAGYIWATAQARAARCQCRVRESRLRPRATPKLACSLARRDRALLSALPSSSPALHAADKRWAACSEMGTGRPAFSLIDEPAVDESTLRQRHLIAMHEMRARSSSAADFARGLERTGSWSTSSVLPPPPSLERNIDVPPGQDLLRVSLALSECRRGVYSDPLQPFTATGGISLR